MRREYLFTIGISDIGKRQITDILGVVHDLTDSIGRVMALDVGKRAYMVGGPPGVVQVENDQQRDARMGTGWRSCAGRQNQTPGKPCAICGHMTHNR